MGWAPRWGTRAGWPPPPASNSVCSDEAASRIATKGGHVTMKVWIDQDLCTGDGLCEEIAPEVFTLLDDGLAYVKEGTDVKNDPGGAEGLAQVPSDLEDA